MLADNFTTAEQGTDEWKDDRRWLVTASDAAAMVGCDERKSYGKLLREKRHGPEPVGEWLERKFAMGRQNEAYVVREAEKRLDMRNYASLCNLWVSHPLGASPDGMLFDQKGRRPPVLLEVKTTEVQLPEVPPMRVLAQTSVGMHCTGLPHAVIAYDLLQSETEHRHTIMLWGQHYDDHTFGLTQFLKQAATEFLEAVQDPAVKDKARVPPQLKHDARRLFAQLRVVRLTGEMKQSTKEG